MMKQPELGKKIVSLRKQLGLTQEELVLKCNLNVRTLQRIESGEVNPRSHTVKSIFEALDYDESAPEFQRYERVKHYLESNFKKYYSQLITPENMSKLKIFFLRFFLATGLIYFFFASALLADNLHYGRMEILLSVVFPLAFAVVRSFEKTPPQPRKMNRFVNFIYQYFLSLGIVWVLIVILLFILKESIQEDQIKWTLVVPAVYAFTTLFRTKEPNVETNE